MRLPWDSPWLPFLKKRAEMQDLSGDFFGDQIYAISSFRKAVLNCLSDKQEYGTVEIYPNGSMNMVLRGDGPEVSRSGTFTSSVRVDLYKHGLKGTFRNCDYVAWNISSGVPGAPSCALWWSENDAIRPLPRAPSS